MIFPQSPINPLTRYVSPPCARVSEVLISGVSSGHRMVLFIPARAAYAASAEPAFPFVGIDKWSKPNSFAIETARANPRALKEPVGNLDSSLTTTTPGRESKSLTEFLSVIRGVITSPNDTRFTSFDTGKSGA